MTTKEVTREIPETIEKATTKLYEDLSLTIDEGIGNLVSIHGVDACYWAVTADDQGWFPWKEGKRREVSLSLPVVVGGSQESVETLEIIQSERANDNREMIKRLEIKFWVDEELIKSMVVFPSDLFFIPFSGWNPDEANPERIMTEGEMVAGMLDRFLNNPETTGQIKGLTRW